MRGKIKRFVWRVKVLRTLRRLLPQSRTLRGGIDVTHPQFFSYKTTGEGRGVRASVGGVRKVSGKGFRGQVAGPDENRSILDFTRREPWTRPRICRPSQIPTRASRWEFLARSRPKSRIQGRQAGDAVVSRVGKGRGPESTGHSCQGRGCAFH